MKAGEATAILTIPPGFEQAIVNRGDYELGLLVDGADANLASGASNYSTMIMRKFLEERLPPGVVIPGISVSRSRSHSAAKRPCYKDQRIVRAERISTWLRVVHEQTNAKPYASNILLSHFLFQWFCFNFPG